MKWIRDNYRMMMVFVLVALMVVVPAGTIKAWSYTVKSGDSLWNIASRTGNSVGNIRSASGVWSDKILPGQRLSIPERTKRTGGSRSRISQAERELMARLVAAEASGEPYKGQVGVAAVILNRVNDSRFPNSVKGVIYQRNAFESVSNGLIWRRTPDSSAYKAVNDALKGWDPSYGSVFFWNPYKKVSSWIWSRPIVVQYGQHVFAK